MKKLYPVLFSAAILLTNFQNSFSQSAIITCPSNTSVSASTAGCMAPVNYTSPTAYTISYTTESHSSSHVITPANAVGCNDGTGNYQTSFFRVYDLTALGYSGNVDIDSVIFGVESTTLSTDTQIVVTRLHTLSGPFVTANLTPLSIDTVILQNTLAGVFRAGYAGVTVPATSIVVAEILIPNGQNSSNMFFLGSNPATQSDSSYIRALDCFITEPTDISTVGFPNMHIILDLLISSQTNVPTSLYSGLASGSQFPLGVNTVTWFASPAAGDTSFCSFNVTVTNPVAVNMSGVPPTICQAQGMFPLAGATPAGGTYFGSNISGNSLNTDVAPLGNNTINYTFTNGFGCSDTGTITTNVINCSGIEDEDPLFLDIYPNPATDYINIEVNTNKNISLKLADLTGRIVVTKTISSGVAVISLQGLTSGIYLVTITDKDSGRQMTRRIVKQ